MYYDGTKDLTRAVKVETLDGYRLRLFFSNGEIKIYNVAPLIEKGGYIAEQLKNMHNFSKAKLIKRRVVWNFTKEPLDDIDICPEVLYWDSISDKI